MYKISLGPTHLNGERLTKKTAILKKRPFYSPNHLSNSIWKRAPHAEGLFKMTPYLALKVLDQTKTKKSRKKKSLKAMEFQNEALSYTQGIRKKRKNIVDAFPSFSKDSLIL